MTTEGTSTTATPPSTPSFVSGLTTCVVGGGNSAHVLIPLLTEAGHNVHLLTRRPDDWQDEVECDDTDGDTGLVTNTRYGRITKKSSNPADVIPQADVIVLCMPVAASRPTLARIAPHISRDKQDVFVGTVFGQAGFNWMVRETVQEHNLTNVVTFAIGQIPWICRALEYGSKGANYGPKLVNVVAVSPTSKFDKLDDIFLKDISFRPYHKGKFRLSGFLSLTMSVDNQIIHPARCYSLYQQSGNGGVWPSMDEVPYFYRDFDQHSADTLAKLDNEYTRIRDAIRKRFPDRKFEYMLSYSELERLNHGSSGDVDILASLRDSQQLASIKTPVLPVVTDKIEGPTAYRLNTQCRFFTDDIPYGLLIAKWMAEKLGVETPFIDEVITWAQGLRNEEFLTDDRKINYEFCLKDKYTSGIPDSYGINNMQDILD